MTDLREALAAHGEFPSPGRYAGAVDPAREGALAQEIVSCGLELAPRSAGELVAAWKRHYPGWSDAIDRARAAAAVLEGLEWRAEPDADAPFLPRLGRFEAVERVGAGSNGVVFRAADHSLSQCGAPVFVALKIVGCATGEQESRLREAGAARALSDAAVPRVLDAGVVPADIARRCVGSDVAIFIASEFIDGQPLYVWKAARPDRSAADCEAIACTLLAAIERCHASGVAHGDISPANVLIDAGGIVRIVDFGLATWRVAEAAAGDGDGNGADELHDRTLRDRRRVRALMHWLVRGLPATRALRSSVDAVERRCDGRPPRRRPGIAGAVALAAVLAPALAFAASRYFGSMEAHEPVGILFGNRLAQRPDLADLARDLLDDGRPTLWTSEVYLAKVRALRAEATDARRRGAPTPDLELLAALAVLVTPERPFAGAFASLAVDGRFGADDDASDVDAPRRELAWAIAWGLLGLDREARPDEWRRIDAVADALGAPGLPALLRGEARLRTVGQDAAEPGEMVTPRDQSARTGPVDANTRASPK